MLEPSASKGPPSLVGENHLEEMIRYAGTTPAGAFVEVGLYKGGSAWHLARLAHWLDRPFYGYDTFAGLPCREEGLDDHCVGDFADVDEDLVRRWIRHGTIVKGWFPTCALEMGPIAFAHLDCDQYQSVKESTAYLIPRMVAGGIIWFDDSPVLKGAKAAAEELLNGRLSLSEHGRNFVVF